MTADEYYAEYHNTDSYGQERLREERNAWRQQDWEDAKGQVMAPVLNTTPTQCCNCSKPHNLQDEDAGTEREELRLCESCFELLVF